MFSLSSYLAGIPARHHATRGVFILCGAAFAIWAALVPTLKSRLGLQEAELGLLILCLGCGSICLMPFAGLLARRFGCRRVMTAVFPIGLLLLVSIALSSSVPMAVISVLLLGATLGTVDVVMNIQAVAVEREAGRPMLSGFHAMYPLGGIVGALFMNACFLLGLAPWVAALIFAVVGLALLVKVLPLCLERQSQEKAATGGKSGLRAAFTPFVILMGLFCFTLFLAEGSVMDWSAIYLRDASGTDPAWGPLGYAALCTSMTLMRLLGSRLIVRFGPGRVVGVGGMLCALSFGLLWFSPGPLLTLLCFFCMGLGSANLIPIFISLAGSYREEAAEASLSLVTTLGYLGILVGPALVGVVAQAVSLPFAYGCVGLLVLAVTATDFALRRTAKQKKSAA